MKKLLRLIRGLPGRGKSTLAQQILLSNCDPDIDIPSAWFEADMYFLDTNGKYVYNKSKISLAHRWCRDEVQRCMESEVDEIIVSNTFCERWEAEPYFEMAEHYGYEVQIVTLVSSFKSVHDIPEANFTHMKERFQNDIST